MVVAGDRRRLLIPQKKVWRQVIRKEDNNTTNTDQQVEQAIAMDDIIAIPNDIIVEILLRLPAKTLLRLQWTCKSWFDLITRDSNFAKMHIHHSSTGNDIFGIISPCVLSTRYNGNKIFRRYLNYNDTTREFDISSEVSIALPFDHPLGCRPLILGSCNGLILLDGDRGTDNLCIWNPFTREYKILPYPLGNRDVWRDEGCTYGFGYDHTNDDYKVIRSGYYKSVSSSDVKLYSAVQIYTLSTNSWRTIGTNPYRLRTGWLSQGVFVNGTVYWMDYVGKSIVRFDFGTETFRHVSATPNSITDLKMYVFEGSVCVVREEKMYSDIWVMKDYAVNNNESLWTKLLTVPGGPSLMWPIKYTRNGEILMVENCRDLVLHDLKKRNAKPLGRICEEYTLVEVVYTESLVSISKFRNL